MNQYFLELRAREKIRELRHEGITSQIHNRDRRKVFNFPGLFTLALGILGILLLLAF